VTPSRALHHTGRLLIGLACAIAIATPISAAAATRAAVPETVSAGSIGIRLLDAPLSERDNPRARVYIIDHLAQGTVIHRQVEVSNTTSSSRHVAIYAAAATIGKGSFTGEAGRTPNQLSSWVSITPAAANLAAGTSLTANVTIAVPHNAPNGEQYAVIWAQVRSAPAPGGGVVQISRAGIRIYLSVGKGSAPVSSFTIKSLTAERLSNGQPAVIAIVHNTGGRALDMSGTLRLTKGPAGLSAGPFAATLGTTLAINDTEPVSIALDKQIPAGPWDAHITLRSGVTIRSAQAVITFPAAGVGPAVTAIATGSRVLTPLHIGVLALVVLLLAVLAYLLRRRRTGEHASPPAPNSPKRTPLSATAAPRPPAAPVASPPVVQPPPVLTMPLTGTIDVLPVHSGRRG
jgi:hypothetical protein